MASFNIVFEELPQWCSGCGLITITRPYGLNHEEICEDCASLDPTLTEIRIKENKLGDYYG